MGNPPTSRRRRRPPVLAVEPAPGRMALTLYEAAYRMNCHPNTVRNLINAGQLESFTLGRKRLVAVSAIEDLIARGGTKEAP